VLEDRASEQDDLMKEAKRVISEGKVLAAKIQRVMDKGNAKDSGEKEKKIAKPEQRASKKSIAQDKPLAEEERSKGNLLASPAYASVKGASDRSVAAVATAPWGGSGWIFLFLLLSAAFLWLGWFRRSGNE
jgi:hypothetical protein